MLSRVNPGMLPALSWQIAKTYPGDGTASNTMKICADSRSSKVDGNVRFSIIVPTFNEEIDIGRTLDALERITWPDYEVIVVDGASRDGTTKIVEQYVTRSHRFQLIKQPENLGVSSGRNAGIRQATGSILVILNADVLLPPDFLSQIAPYYRAGNHWVAVESNVLNTETAYARFNQAEHWHFYRVANNHFVWTEGFSCTKEAAIAVGLFPEQMPGAGGEDRDFSFALETQFPGVRALDLAVPHIVPDTFRGYWAQAVGRGKARTNYYSYMSHMSLPRLLVHSSLATGWRIAKSACLVPVILSWKYAAFSDRGRRDFLAFVAVAYVKEIAMLFGIWRAFIDLVRAPRSAGRGDDDVASAGAAGFTSQR